MNSIRRHNFQIPWEGGWASAPTLQVPPPCKCPHLASAHHYLTSRLLSCGLWIFKMCKLCRKHTHCEFLKTHKCTINETDVLLSKSLEKLPPLVNTDVTVTLPSGAHWLDYEYLSIWCDTANVSFGHVYIPRDLLLPPYSVSRRRSYTTCCVVIDSI